MPSIEVAATLPYLLRLEMGSYSSLIGGRTSNIVLRDTAGVGSEPSQERQTQVSLVFDGNVATDDDIQLLKTQKVEDLLQHTNRLLRWYRVSTGRAEVIDLARAQASPYQFSVVEENGNLSSTWTEPIVFEALPLPLDPGQTEQSITEAVRSGLTSKNDPEVSALFLLDAEQALREGRFREAVLFCWSAIDSTFSQKYKSLVEGAIQGKDERDSFITFRNASMRYRMSAGLHFCTGLSLYDQPNELWTKLFTSYSKRNSIIHDGASAQETDADLALLVARQVINFLATLTAKPQDKGSITAL